MIIGLSGGMGVGKSTAVKLIREALFTSTVELIKFAQPLYDIQEYIYDRIGEDVYTRPAGFVKDRKLLQWIGTEWGRNTISQTLWVDLWRSEVELSLEAHPSLIIICDDVRFDNEAEMVKSMGGMVINITSEQVSKRIDTKAGITAHASEAGLRPDLVDATIKNDKDFKHFELDLLKVIREFSYGGMKKTNDLK